MVFLSTFVNKVDRKGRISVPATFRAALQGQAFNGIVAYRSFRFPAIEGSAWARVEEMSARLDTLEQFSEEHDILSSLFADIRQLPFDGEGRIVLPEDLVAHAGIGESAAFVGQGSTFQIWEPEAHRRHQEEMRDRARSKGITLPARGGAAPVGGR